MPETPHRIVRAWLESLTRGIVELDRDWSERTVPKFRLSGAGPAIAELSPAPGLVAGRAYGYYLNAHGELCFVLPVEHGNNVDPARDTVYVAGDFNGWQGKGAPEWEMKLTELDGERVYLWSGDPARFLGEGNLHFKFVTGEQQWLVPPDDAPNLVRDDSGNLNRSLNPSRTGWHLWQFTLNAPADLAEPREAGWTEPNANGSPRESVAVTPGAFFYALRSDLPMGAIVQGDKTIFRLFAPRARKVAVFYAQTRAALEGAAPVELTRRADAHGVSGVWETVASLNLHGWYYWYSIDGVQDGPGKFSPTVRVLDPYALASLDRFGPGIVLDRAWIGQGDRGFRTPSWQDLIIAEAHVRDLAAHAPVKMSPEERRGFSGLRKWVESPEFYLHRLGVNCVELQPVQEFDNVGPDDYHWGYMTNNFFSPESSYAVDPAKASGVRELQELVRAFHRRGIAVLLDVVYNHVGEPAHLMLVDRLYYFETDAAGTLANWSGCGNDLRARSAMATRLIIDSCTHLIEAYGIDGFRFDLAELLGVEVLREIETALKRVKPEVVLIAEPWSFRGHIAGVLRETGWSSWNDGFRDFVRDYVLGAGPASQLEYCLKGSPWYFAKWPAQTLNYTESHDDRAWIDLITENAGFDGSAPTLNDRRRTHLMAAVLFMSLGIPMLAAGQDFLRTKKGFNNTYQRGDLNALDYRRLYRYLGTHAYFADWIAFRRGDRGHLLRQFSRPTEGFFRTFSVEDKAPLAIIYNADRSQGALRLLFAINATTDDITLPLPEDVASAPWRQVANQDRFFIGEGQHATEPVEAELFIPALGCGLWEER